MTQYRSLNHTRRHCTYHVVFIPTYRKKVLYHELRVHLGEVFRTLTEQKESRVEAGHLMPDHVHMMLSIPPKYVVSQVLGFIKGKSAIHIARTFAGRKRNFVGQHSRARGYFVSTVGADEETVREYIRNQESEDRRTDQLRLLQGLTAFRRLAFRSRAKPTTHKSPPWAAPHVKPPALPRDTYTRHRASVLQFRTRCPSQVSALHPSG